MLTVTALKEWSWCSKWGRHKPSAQWIHTHTHAYINTHTQTHIIYRANALQWRYAVTLRQTCCGWTASVWKGTSSPLAQEKGYWFGLLYLRRRLSNNLWLQGRKQGVGSVLMCCIALKATPHRKYEDRQPDTLLARTAFTFSTGIWGCVQLFLFFSKRG